MILVAILAALFLLLGAAFDLSGQVPGAIWAGALAAGLVVLFGAADHFERRDQEEAGQNTLTGKSDKL